MVQVLRWFLMRYRFWVTRNLAATLIRIVGMGKHGLTVEALSQTARNHERKEKVPRTQNLL